MTLRFIGLGGTDEVGASSYLYLLQEGRLLIDAGLRPGQLGDAALPQLDLLREHPPTAMVLTHAHLDHVAALPLVTRRFPELPVYCTAATARLAAVVLADTLKVNTAQGHPVFTARDMTRALDRLQPTPYGEWVTGHGFAFQLRPSGHLLGAASVMIRSGGRHVVHSGDVSNVDTPVVNAMWLPAPGSSPPVDAVVSESTYGDTLLPSRKEQVSTFIAAIAQTIHAGGRVLIPSFALGRAQEITVLLQTAMQSGLLPPVPLYLDGLTRRMTETYTELLPELPLAIRQRVKTGGKPPFFSGTVEAVQDAQARERIIARPGPAIVIASSGMLHAGASPLYARAWLPDPDSALFVVGYQDAESPGRRLLELQQGGEVQLPDGRGGFDAVPAYARVERFYLSAHADRGGLIAMVARYAPGKVVLTHGEVHARSNLAGYLNRKYDVALPRAGEVVDLVDSGRRRGQFINTTPKRLEALKERHTRAAVSVRYDAHTHEVRIALPAKVDGALFGEGDYTLEVLRGKLSRVKLSQRDPDTAPSATGQDEPEGGSGDA